MIDGPGRGSHDDDTASSVGARAGLRLGQLRPRSERVGHNARWHLASEGRHWSLGWGDLSESDLHQLRLVLGRALFLGLCEGLDEPAWPLYRAVQPLPDWACDSALLASQTQWAVSVEGGVIGIDPGLPAGLKDGAARRGVHHVGQAHLLLLISRS